VDFFEPIISQSIDTQNLIIKSSDESNDNCKRLEGSVDSLRKTIQVLTSTVNNSSEVRRSNNFDDLHKKEENPPSINRRNKRRGNKPPKKDSGDNLSIKKKICMALRDGKSLESIRKSLSTIKIKGQGMNFGHSQFTPGLERDILDMCIEGNRFPDLNEWNCPICGRSLGLINAEGEEKWLNHLDTEHVLSETRIMNIYPFLMYGSPSFNYANFDSKEFIE
jgi:hypothetical protein